MNVWTVKMIVMLSTGAWTGPWDVVPILRRTITDRYARIDYVVPQAPCQCDACRRLARHPTPMD